MAELRWRQHRPDESVDLYRQALDLRQALGQTHLAAEALATLERRKITSLVVADPDGQLLGVLHLHDLWGIQLI